VVLKKDDPKPEAGGVISPDARKTVNVQLRKVELKR
jgi:hypothetical protein